MPKYNFKLYKLFEKIQKIVLTRSKRSGMIQLVASDATKSKKHLKNL